MPIGATVVFSSVAGRFGNAGQTDYSAANDLLCAMSSALRRDAAADPRDRDRLDGVGRHRHGHPRLDPADHGRGGHLDAARRSPASRPSAASSWRAAARARWSWPARSASWARSTTRRGGLDVEKAKAALAARKRPLLMVGAVKAARLHGGLAVETTLDPKEQPFLLDHQIDGVPVLPGVMGTEAFAEVASVLCPGFHVAAVEDESFLAAVQVPPPPAGDAPPPRRGVARRGRGGRGRAPSCGRSSSRSRSCPAQERVHFTGPGADAPRGAGAPKVAFKKPAAKDARPIGREAIYEVYFHGPAYQVIERAAVEGDGVVGPDGGRPPAERESRRAPTRSWRRASSSCCFQAAGLWLLAKKETMGLPTALERAARYRPEDAAGERRLYAVVEARDGRRGLRRPGRGREGTRPRRGRRLPDGRPARARGR